MGSKQAGSRVANKDAVDTSAILADNRPAEEAFWEEKVEIHHCCGVSMEKVRKSTPLLKQNASIGRISSSTTVPPSLTNSSGPHA